MHHEHQANTGPDGSNLAGAAQEYRKLRDTAVSLGILATLSGVAQVIGELPAEGRIGGAAAGFGLAWATVCYARESLATRSAMKQPAPEIAADPPEAERPDLTPVA